jgi:hypothetical protein
MILKHPAAKTRANALASRLFGKPRKPGTVQMVHLAGERGTYQCEVRTAGGSPAHPGDIVWVEFGGFKSSRTGQRHDGQWRACIVEAKNSDALRVRLWSGGPPPKTKNKIGH